MTLSHPSGETDLATILTTLTVVRRPGAFHVTSLLFAEAGELTLGAGIEALIREPDEGGDSITVVCDEATLVERGWSSTFAAAWLTLDVHTSLEAIGLTAAISKALGAAGIPCNVVAGYLHDHILVPVERADDAIGRLHALRDGARP